MSLQLESLWSRYLFKSLKYSSFILDRSPVGADDQDWNDFAVELERVFGQKPFTTKEIVAICGSDSDLAEALPGELADKYARAPDAAVSKSLGRFLANRDGRWAGQLVVRRVGVSSQDKTNRWAVSRSAQPD